jgi:hypothetical protein
MDHPTTTTDTNITAVPSINYPRTPSPSTPNRNLETMNQNQTESKPPNVEEPREEKLDETTYSRSDSEHPSLVAKLKEVLA